jgi:hypothetical protein
MTLPAAAQDPSPSPSPSPEPAPAKIDVTGFVDVYYMYNLNETDPFGRTFDVQHNTFSLSLAEVAFAKAVTPDSRVGFRVDLDFGETADLVDNWNYSRSILFGYAIPFYHTGVRATVNATDKVILTGHIVNGWNNTSEINGNKTVHLGPTLKPTGKVTWIGNYMFGKETPGSDAVRNLFDTTLTLVPTPKLSLMANFDYGKEGDTSWWGIDGYAKYQATGSWALVGRYEYVDDTDGGFMTFGTKVQSVTITSDHLVAGGLKLRLEHQGNFADEPVFPKDDGSTRKSQTTLTVGLVYGFGGKI